MHFIISGNKMVYTYMDVHSSIYCAFLQFPVLRRKEPSDDVHPSYLLDIRMRKPLARADTRYIKGAKSKKVGTEEFREKM